MEDFNLTPEPKWFMIGKRKYNVARISAERSLKAAAMYNKKIKGVPDGDAFVPYESTYDLIVSLLDCVFMLFRVDFILNPIEWFKRIIVTKRHILKTIDGSVIMDFVEDALDPIIGEKKKALMMERKTAEAMMIVMEAITPEALAKLLESSLQGLDTKKSTF
jgi:hypothetical protein